METLKGFLNRIAHASGGRASPPFLIAVSKFQPVDQMLELYRQGQRDFGENYVQELISKAHELQDRGAHGVRFHFIGKLQSNKVKQLLPFVSIIHSVDSLKLLREIDKQARAMGMVIPVFFQVNIDREPTKGGFDPADLSAIPPALSQCTGVIPRGLMAIPNPELDPESAFRRMQELSQQHSATLGAELSMGMSADFESAIRFGATHVRIGTALFGARKPIS
jgi:hypothetical protein